MTKLIRIDRNGTKYYEGMVPCDRCGGNGYYALGTHNGHPVLSPHDGGVCWKCGGTGKVYGKWVERTAEYQAKLDAKAKAKWEKKAAEQEKIRKEKEAQEEAERLEREAKIKTQKAISQHVGEIGQRITFKVRYTFGTSWDTRYGVQYLYSFKDEQGNVLVWKTSSIPMVLNDKGEDVILNKGDWVNIKGTIKDHTEYRDEKQTVLTRCKLTV